MPVLRSLSLPAMFGLALCGSAMAQDPLRSVGLRLSKSIEAQVPVLESDPLSSNLPIRACKIVFTGNGSELAILSYGELSLVNVETGQCRRLDVADVMDVASLGESRLALLAGEGLLEVDVAAGKPRYRSFAAKDQTTIDGPWSGAGMCCLCATGGAGMWIQCGEPRRSWDLIKFSGGATVRDSRANIDSLYFMRGNWSSGSVDVLEMDRSKDPRLVVTLKNEPASIDCRTSHGMTKILLSGDKTMMLTRSAEASPATWEVAELIHRKHSYGAVWIRSGMFASWSGKSLEMWSEDVMRLLPSAVPEPDATWVAPGWIARVAADEATGRVAVASGNSTSPRLTVYILDVVPDDGDDRKKLEPR